MDMQRVIVGDVVLLDQPFNLDEVSLCANGRPPTFEESDLAAATLSKISHRIKYWKGDLINLIEATHGEQASQILDKDFGEEKEINECRFVAKHVSPDVRLQSPSFEHSKAIAGIKSVKDQEKWIQRALDEDWIPSKLAAEIAKAGAGGKSAMRFLLIVDAGTEAKQTALAKSLEKDGFQVTIRTGVKKDAKAKGGKKKKPAQYKLKKGDKVLTIKGDQVTQRTVGKRVSVKPYQRRKATKR